MLDWLGSIHQRLNSRPWPIIFITFASAIFTCRHFALIHYHAVNILYWDQWGFFDPLFIGKRWWELFRWQHGPWRQGVGILSYLLAEQTRWDSRAESFFIGFLVLMAMLAALWLKRRLFGKFEIYDIAVPLIVLTTTQFQTYVGAVNSAPTAFPMFLIVLYCLAWTVKRRLLRNVLVLALNFLLVNTGYGLFIGGITFALFAIESWNHRQQRFDFLGSVLALIVSAITATQFFSDYNLEHFNGSVEHRTSRIWDYPLFASFMLGRFIRPYPNRIAWFTYLAMAFGIGLLLLATIALLVHLRQILNKKCPDHEINLVITILLGYGLLFVGNAAWGRAGMGLNGSQSSRFMTLIIPLALGLYFHLLTLKKERIRQFALAAFLLLLLPGHLPLRLGENHPATYFSQNKQVWKDCFLRIEDRNHCDQLTGFAVIDFMDPAVLQRRIEFMKRNRLNLYKNAEANR